MSKYDYDVLYVGAGHGTFDGAIPLASKGYKVGVIEKNRIGGTCPNWGCNAKISLDAPIQLVHAQKRMSDLVNGSLSVNWAGNMKHKHHVIDGLPNAIGGLMKNANIDIIKGEGVLADAHTVKVNGQSKTADKIVLATGLHSHRLNIDGSDLANDSQDFLNMDSMPKRLAVIGSGYIAMEFATIALESGSQVTVLMHHDRVLKQFYAPYVDKLVADLKRRGMKFIPNAGVAAFAKKGDALAVKYGNGKELPVDYILDATGRVPNVKNIGLDKVGVKYDRHGIKVNDHLQTSVPSIYASGDVINSKKPKLTPTAIFESSYLTQLFSGGTKDAIDFPYVPTVAFTSPRIAEFGVSPDEAKKSDQYTVKHADLTGDWYRVVDEEKIADLTLVFNKQKQLVGATEISDQADNVINSLVMVADMKLTSAQVHHMIYLFPSITDDAFLNL